MILLLAALSLVALLLLGIIATTAFVVDQLRYGDEPDVGLDILQPYIGPSPLLMCDALNEHEPVTWKQHSRIWGQTHIRRQRQRIRILSTDTQSLDRVALLEALLTRAREWPVVQRQVWAGNGWVAQPVDAPHSRGEVGARAYGEVVTP